MMAWSRVRRVGVVLLPMLILGVTAWELRRQMIAMDWVALRLAFSRIDAVAMWESVLATAASFLGLALIEAWAVRQQPGMQVPAVTAMTTGAASHALGHVLGWHAVLGMLVRRRAYGGAPQQLLGILLAVGAAVISGVAAALVISAAGMYSRLWAGLVVAMVLTIAVLVRRVEPVRNGPTSLRWITRQLQRTAGILPIALLEAAAALTAMWVLIPGGTFASWPVFVVTCLLAQAAGVISHVPGGIGVFEAAMLASVPIEARPGLLAAILGYRAIYGLLPFATLGVPWLVWSSLLRRRPLAQSPSDSNNEIQLDAG